MKRILVLACVLGLIGAGSYAYSHFGSRPAMAFRTAPVQRSDLQVAISATGTVEPEEVVDVGAQVAGKVESFGSDPRWNGSPIDYGSEVEVGTVLARIDDSLFVADVASSTAQLKQTQASVIRAQADKESKVAAQAQAEAGVELAKITYDHLAGLPKNSASLIELRTADATLKQAQAALGTARANVAVSEAELEQARKSVMQAEANLTRTKANLDYCTIRSPVKGTIVDRRVNIGQTVVSSLNAPSLFLIAKDLKRMQVWASVNEADIGNIHAGQTATFTVDAFPGRTFTGIVGKIRLNATMTQNVVTYTVEIATDNSDGKLLPYLTANVQFEVMHLKDVLTVPNVALRWKPPPQMIERGARSTPARPQGRGAAMPVPRNHARESDVLWVADGGQVKSISVRAGQTDGSRTQIEGGGIQEGMAVVVGEATQAEVAEKTTNPFTPQLFRNRRGQ